MMSESSPVTTLRGKRILLGVTGSIAAYKAADLVRQLKKAGADVQVLMTDYATKFIPEITLATLSGQSVLNDLFESGDTEAWTKHITLGHWADLFLIAPTTAQTLAKLASGFSDNMLTATALAARCPVLVCPAMDHDMYLHPAVVSNIERLAELGYHILPPEHGELASGMVGMGRLPNVETIIEHVSGHLKKTLDGKRALVTAGPTQEPIDPVRVLTNPSTGTMGFALAQELAHRGAQVTLIAGPTLLSTPVGVDRVNVTTSAEMLQSVLSHKDADCIFMAAAVADYTPVKTHALKLKKQKDEIFVHLQKTTDILAQLGQLRSNDQLLVGFAMETGNGLEHAQKKLKQKNLDWIVLNDLHDEGAGFGTETNRVTLISKDGACYPMETMPKQEVASALLNHILVHCE